MSDVKKWDVQTTRELNADELDIVAGGLTTQGINEILEGISGIGRLGAKVWLSEIVQGALLVATRSW
jgi:hypothetical protein